MENKEDNTSQTALAVLIICAVVLLFPVVASSVPGKLGSMADPWRDMVFNYQTLFAGILAVGAAYLSVRQMNVTDERSEQRHKELVQLQLRPDRLRFERAINPQLDELIEISGALKRIDLDVTPYEIQAGDVIYLMIGDICFDYRNQVVRLIDVFSRKPWIDGTNLFDGRLTRKLEVLQTSLGQLRTRLDRHRQMTGEHVTVLDGAFYQEMEFEESKLQFLSELVTAPFLLDEVISEIQRTKDEYRKA